MYISICFWAFSSSWKEEFFFLLNKCSRNGWATAQLSCGKKKFVLQPCNCIARERAEKKNCIAIQLLYCRLGGLAGLYCSMGENCIAGCCIVL